MSENINKDEASTPPRFSADQPISSASQDLLGRAKLATAVSDAISGWKGKESLVVALYGDWGSGKSSLKNLVVEHAEKKDKPPLVVEFNPWFWSGDEHLISTFFDQIGTKLGYRDPSKEAQQVYRRWTSYAAMLQAGAGIVEGLKEASVALLTFSAASGIGSQLLADGWASTLLKGLMIFSLALAAVLPQLEKTISKFLIWLEAKSNVSRHDISAAKQSLSNALLKYDNPILVIIDDVDRLPAEEIRLLVRLVKVNADFPNVIYFLLFQRDIVEEALDDISGGRGQDYLEKIVQVGFQLPQPSRSQIQEVLFKQINNILDSAELESRFDKQRWRTLFISGLAPYFQNLRDVYRLTDSLDFHVGLFRNEKSFEVNPVDLIALEVIRVFEPGIYKMLPLDKDILVQKDEWNPFREIEKQHTDEWLKSALNNAKAERRERARAILEALFPTLSGKYGHDRFQYELEWFRELRACHPDVFDRYFQFAVAQDELSQAELDRILSLATDRSGLAAELQTLAARGKLYIALKRLEAYKNDIPPEAAVPFITAICDVSDDFPHPPPGVLEDMETQATRVIYFYLKREKDRKKRFEILTQAIRDSIGLCMPFSLGRFEERRETAKRSDDEYLVENKDVAALQKLCVEKIRKAAASGVLARNLRLGILLHCWHDWDPSKEPREWVQGLTRSQEGLLLFLVGMLGQSTVSSNRGTKVTWVIYPSHLERFVNLQEVEEVLSQLSVDGLPEMHVKAIEAFKKAMKRKAEGKPEADRVPIDEDEEP